MASSEKYTFGWVCALNVEYTAARLFLDEEYDAEDSFSQPGDNNAYTFGRMGKHNIVIAVMPAGEYGTFSAASVARDMVRSFPDLRAGLMVGIGGGAPRKDVDIRLGDIVVSSPSNGKGGVYQYDLGKSVQGKKFMQTGHLDQPPPFLLTALQDLKSRIEAAGHDFRKEIDSIVDANKRLRKKYGCPPLETDRLFESTHTHPDKAASCNEVCATNTPATVQRPKREEDDDNPAIHYGLIASGNSLMKDAVARDALSKSEGVLCFEMKPRG